MPRVVQPTANEMIANNRSLDVFSPAEHRTPNMAPPTPDGGDSLYESRIFAFIMAYSFLKIKNPKTQRLKHELTPNELGVIPKSW